MRVLLLSRFYPAILDGQERHVRDLARARTDRRDEVAVAMVAADGRSGTTVDGAVTVHRLRTSAQRLPDVDADQERPHAMPVPDPALRAGTARLLATTPFDVAHAHEWTVNSQLLLDRLRPHRVTIRRP
jgi:hypothetical protein